MIESTRFFFFFFFKSSIFRWPEIWESGFPTWSYQCQCGGWQNSGWLFLMMSSFSSSDYLIHHFNHLSLLPKMMTKLIILTFENFHKLTLTYLILSDFWCFPEMDFPFQSIELPSCHPHSPFVYICLLAQSKPSSQLACSTVQ